jgi:CheY-like chemotaxis protein
MARSDHNVPPNLLCDGSSHLCSAKRRLARGMNRAWIIVTICHKRTPTMAVRTLIVDDEPTARMILRRRLAVIGCDIVGEATNSYAAAEMINQMVPDLVTLDLQMPEFSGMDSYELFRKIRQVRPAVEFVVISGACYLQNRQDFMRNGAIGYFAKPIDFSGLLSDLRYIFPELQPYRPPAAIL